VIVNFAGDFVDNGDGTYTVEKISIEANSREEAETIFRKENPRFEWRYQYKELYTLQPEQPTD
jgi:hypothetical protein